MCLINKTECCACEEQCSTSGNVQLLEIYNLLTVLLCFIKCVCVCVCVCVCICALTLK